MSGNCNSNPNNGCTDSQTLTELQTFTDGVELHLSATISAIAGIITDFNLCCSTNNTKLTDALSNLQTIIDNAEDCCDAIQAALGDVIGTLEDITGYVATTTTTVPVATTTTTSSVTVTTTTTVPVTTTTTTATPTTTTTTVPGNTDAWFYANSDIDWVCLDSNPVHLFYNGLLQDGTILYTGSVGGTLFTAYEYVRVSTQTTVYQVNTSSGAIIATFTSYCE